MTNERLKETLPTTPRFGATAAVTLRTVSYRTCSENPASVKQSGIRGNALYRCRQNILSRNESKTRQYSENPEVQDKKLTYIFLFCRKKIVHLQFEIINQSKNE